MSPSCTVIYPVPDGGAEDEEGEYDLLYTGSGYTIDINNPGNYPEHPPIYQTYPGILTTCAAAQQCADDAHAVRPDSYLAFDLHYLSSKQSWECIQFYYHPYPASNGARYFTVQNDDAVAVFYYSNQYY